MTKLNRTGFMAGALALGLVSPALSHHTHAMFDHSKDITINGTVMGFAYVNPHGSLNVAVLGDNGQMTKYWIEMSNLTNMVDRGITPNTFKRGDKITVKMHPLKDGRPGGSYITITAADGHVYE